jgi:D-alanyl-lipoteichoic acid acyltransferase DltB (MBOAT superfamily)
MAFDTFSYIVLFLPIVLLSLHLARLSKIQILPQVSILVASAVFYAWTSPTNLAYLVGSILANWLIARSMTGATELRRKRILQLGLVLNIVFLSVFKYLNFFIGNIPYMVRRHIQVPNLGLPLGISFFTLAQIMYLVDCYEELIPPSSLFDHATFVSFFPSVISGPISRAKRILHEFPALNGRTGPSSETMACAIYLFSLGLIKKVVLAAAFSQPADFGFSNMQRLSAVEAWMTVSSYTLQIYFDFSGYTDMAIASALMLGIELPRNFDAPLRSKSIIEFWQRWHITLSGFITTYLYTPILTSFKRATLLTAAFATLIAMAIAGLWHGPSWNFVLFGVVHGAALATNQFWRKKKMPKLPRWLSWLVTFVVIDLAFLFFRAPDLSTANRCLPHLIGFNGGIGIENLRGVNGTGMVGLIFLFSQLIGTGAAFFGKTSDQLAREFKPTWTTYVAASAYLLIAFLFINSNVGKPFVYFRF